MAVSNAFRSAINAQHTAEEVVTLIRLEHAQLDAAEWPNGILLVNHAEDVSSNGLTYVAAQFEVPWPDQDPDRVSPIRAAIASTPEIRTALLEILTPVKVTMTDVLLSQPDTVDLGPLEMELRRIRMREDTIVEGEIMLLPVAEMPYPADTMNPGNRPGLF